MPGATLYLPVFSSLLFTQRAPRRSGPPCGKGFGRIFPKECADTFGPSTCKWSWAEICPSNALHPCLHGVSSLSNHMHLIMQGQRGAAASGCRLTLSNSGWQRVVAAVLSRGSHSGLISSSQVAGIVRLTFMTVKTRAELCLTKAGKMMNGH